MCIRDSGLPRVVGHVEVSCRGRIIGRSLRNLADRIFTVAIDEHLPGNLPAHVTFYYYARCIHGSRDVESLFFCGTLTPTPGLENLGLQTPTPTPALKNQDSGSKFQTPTPERHDIV